MPKVPEYGVAPQVSPAALPGVRQAPSMSTGMMMEGARQADQLGKGLTDLGSNLARQQIDAQNQANQVRVDDAINKAKEAALDLTYNQQTGFTTLRGNSALDRPAGKPLPDEYAEKLQNRLNDISGTLGNDAQKQAFTLHANDLVTQLKTSAQQHVFKEYTNYQQSVQEGTVKTAANSIALDPLNAQTVTDNVAAINSAVYNAGRLAGKSAEEITAMQSDTVSKVHGDAIKTLMAKQNVEGAQAYFAQYKDQMGGLARAEVGEKLQAAGNALVSMKKADDIWAVLGPKADGQPVQLDKMEARARELFPEDAAKVKGIVTELRERAAAFNASEGERAAGNINTIMAAYSKGTSLAKLQQMPEFLALPGKQQSDIIQHVSDRAHMLSVRGDEDRNRAEANMARRNFGAFLIYSNPDTLASMSESQVQALLPVLGNQLTDHLMEKKRTLGTKEGHMQASMDQQDFDHVADQMGMKPYDPHKNEDDKRALGELKYKMETLIDIAQQSKKQPLTRGEKQELVRQEMARTVPVNNSWWFGSTSKPVIQLTPDEAARVVVPAAERPKIVDALKQMYQKSPNNPQYAPTEDNVRRLYLRGQSRAAQLIPNAR